MKVKIINSLKIVAIVGLFSSSLVWAAKDGDVGSTSTGDLDITVNVPDLVRISAFTDITIDFSGGAVGDSTSGSDNLCVYRNASGGAFYITATGDGGALGGGTASTAFEVSNGSNSAAYTVNFTDGNGTVLALATATQSNSGELDAAHETDPTCGGGTNTSVEVVFANSALAALPSSTYKGNLELTVAPE